MFENGLESPFIGIKRGNATEIKSYPVPDKRIEKITGHVGSNYLTKFALMFDDNQELAVFPNMSE